MVKRKNETKIMWKTSVFALAMMAAVISLTGCPEVEPNTIDFSNVDTTVRIESVDAPRLTAVYDDTGVELKWEPVLDAQNYLIFKAERGLDGVYSEDELIHSGSVTETNYKDLFSTINVDAVYRYRVQAKTDKENLADNETVIEVSIKPSYVSSLEFNVYHDGEGKVYLSWLLQDGYSYTVKRELISSVGLPIQEKTVASVGDGTKKINDRIVFVDTIEKAFGSSSIYTYSLVGTKAGHRDDVASGLVSGYTTYGVSVSSVSQAAGNPVIFIINSSDDSIVYKFYRAEVTDLYSPSYLTEYEDITSNVSMTNTEDYTEVYGYKRLTYSSTALTETGKIYSYNVKAIYKGNEIDLYTINIQIH